MPMKSWPQISRGEKSTLDKTIFTLTFKKIAKLFAQEEGQREDAQMLTRLGILAVRGCDGAAHAEGMGPRGKLCTEQNLIYFNGET